MKFSHPLMHNNFTTGDINAAINLLRNKNKILTQSKYVKEFESKYTPESDNPEVINKEEFEGGSW